MDAVENPPNARHVLVIYDRSAAARGALAEAASSSAEHAAALTVVALVVRERRTVGCCVPAGRATAVDEQLSEARAMRANAARTRIDEYAADASARYSTWATSSPAPRSSPAARCPRPFTGDRAVPSR